ncbi:hypothetical protein [Photobacterium kasasachensis]|uniref:hypothetical protein n=1 Tax=Photobacterium kasasachensis TaxID=2910240 RepID=UPI003D0CA67D
MDIDSRVKLISFNGATLPPEACDTCENYWLLVGKTGTIKSAENERFRVLVQFDEPVSDLGLHCHNAVPNSLLILTSDLTPIA